MADVADVVADCSGLSWSELAAKLDLKSIDCDDVMAVEGNRAETDSMKLKKEEMMLYGLCPAQDEFFLVICEYCHLLIKPQALQYHMDVRHQNYSNSHVHNCALPLCSVNPNAVPNTKCSLHKTNSSISAQSICSQPGRSCTSKPPKGRPAKARVLSSLESTARNTAEKSKPDSSTALRGTFSESSVPQKSTAAAKRNPVSIGALESRVSNAILDKTTDAPLITSVQDISSFSTGPMALDVKIELKDFDDSLVLEPSHLKISEEKEALVKLFESNEWCNFDIKQENDEKLLGISYSPSESDQSRCQAARTCDMESYANSANSSLVAVVKTLTLTTTTCSVSKSLSSHVISPGVGSVIDGGLLKNNTKYSSIFRTCSSFVETPLMNDINRSTGNRADAEGIVTAGGLTRSPETFALKTADILSKDHDRVKLNTKTQSQTQGILDKEAGQLKNLSESNCHSASNVILKVPLKQIKGGKTSPKFLLCKDREFDPNKHCGVWVEEIQKQCTRSLTCKSHSLSLRRAVSGRIKAFDQLLNEQRERKTLTKDKTTNCNTKLKDKPKSKLSNEGEASTNSASRMFTVSASSLSSNASFNNNIVTSSEHQSSQTAALGQHCDTIKRPTTFSNLSRPVKPFCASRENSVIPTSLSVNEERTEDGVKDEALVAEGTSVEGSGCCVMSHHPHPAAVNGFNSWLYGRGCFVFNRKEDLIRAAFLAAVEKHLNPSPYKKLCLESKLTSDVGSSNKDPYDFILPDGAKGRTQLPPSLPSQVARVKVKQISPSAQTSQRSNSTIPSNRIKRSASDGLENKRKIPKTDQTRSDEMLSKVNIMSTKSADVFANNLPTLKDINNSSGQLPGRQDSSALVNGQGRRTSSGELLLSSSPHQSQSSELRLSQPLLPQLNKITPKIVQTISKTVSAASETLPLSAKIVPSYNFAQNAGIKLELRPVANRSKFAMAESDAVSLISDPSRQILSQDFVAAKPPSCSSVAGNSLLRPATSLVTASKIPNIVLTPPLPNGTLKVAPCNASVKNLISSSSQSSLTAILRRKQDASKLTTLTESQAFVSAKLSSTGKANQITTSMSSDTSELLNHKLPISATVQVHAALTVPVSQTPTQNSSISTASAGVSIGSRQYILSSDMRQVYSTQVSSTPKKPIAGSRVQVLRPDPMPSSKTAPSTTALVAGSKCRLSGQPI